MEALVGYESDDGDGKTEKSFKNRVNKSPRLLQKSHQTAKQQIDSKFIQEKTFFTREFVNTNWSMADCSVID